MANSLTIQAGGQTIVVAIKDEGGSNTTRMSINGSPTTFPQTITTDTTYTFLAGMYTVSCLIDGLECFGQKMYFRGSESTTIAPAPTPQQLAQYDATGGGTSSVPNGGTTNQALLKNSNANGDTKWATLATISGSNPAALGGAQTPGATGQSSDAGHIHDTSALATQANLAGMVGFSWVAGRWYAAALYGSSAGGSAGTGLPVDFSTAIYVPLLVPGNLTGIDQLAIYLDTAGSAGSTIRAGLYTDGSGLPGTLITDLGTKVTTGTGLVTWTFTAQALARGIAWVALVVVGGSTMPGLRYIQPGSSPFIGNDSASQMGFGGLVSHTGAISGALPGTADINTTSSTAYKGPVLQVRAAA